MSDDDLIRSGRSIRVTTKFGDDDTEHDFEVLRLTVQPDDVIVVRPLERLGADQASELSYQLGFFFPANKVLVVNHRYELAVVAREDRQDSKRA